MFRQLVIRILAAIVLWAWTAATGPPIWAQHGGGGGHFGGGHFGGSHFGGGHHYGGGHYGGWGHSAYLGHYGGYSHGYYTGHGSAYHHYSPLTGMHHYSGSHYSPYRHYYYGHHYYPYYGHSYWPWHYGYGSSVYSVYGSVPRVSSSIEPRANAESNARETSAGLEYLRRAETAFRSGDYEQAVRWANHAIIEMPRHGKHYLLLSQALFAVGEYRESAAIAQQGMTLLSPAEWGDVVKNFRRYYTGNNYVDQMRRLEKFALDNPGAAYARFLIGYHYGFLGHTAKARGELARAVELESRDEMARRLLELFGGQPTTTSADAQQPMPTPGEPATSQPTSHSTSEQNEPVQYPPPRSPAKPQ